MELRQLKTFRAVARHLNFTLAAKQLNYAQSSVSAQIQSLEEDLNVKLFDRIGRGIILTEAGEKLYEYARRIEVMTEEIRAEVSDAKDPKGHLRIRAPETLSSVFLPRVVERFHSRCPNVSLSFINCTDKGLKEELNTGIIDLAFLLTDSVRYKDVNVSLLRTEDLVLVSHCDHPLASRSPFGIKALAGQTLLLALTDCRYRKPFESLLEENGVKVRLLEYSSTHAMRVHLLRGFGITICPRIAVGSELRLGRLVTLPLITDYLETALVMIWHAEKWCSPNLRIFMQLAEEILKQ
jgi:DNA-binding transcriptional LysR family regulator